jgi:hypothetical protein
MDLTPEQLTEAWTIVMQVKTGQPIPDAGKKEFCAGVAGINPKKRAKAFQAAFARMQWLPFDQCQKIDALLAAAGLPNLEVLGGSFDEDQTTAVHTVLKRGSIESEDERDAVEEALDDGTWDLSHKQRVKLGEALNEFHRKPPMPGDD